MEAPTESSWLTHTFRALHLLGFAVWAEVAMFSNGLITRSARSTTDAFYPLKPPQNAETDFEDALWNFCKHHRHFSSRLRRDWPITLGRIELRYKVVHKAASWFYATSGKFTGHNFVRCLIWSFYNEQVYRSVDEPFSPTGAIFGGIKSPRDQAYSGATIIQKVLASNCEVKAG